MSNQTTIKCPNCGTEIDVNEVLYHQLESKYKNEHIAEKKKLEAEVELKRKEYKQAFDALQVKPLNFNAAQESSDEWKEFLKTWITSDNFDIMLHSFYNNLNAEVTDNEIYVDSERTNTDLNGLRNVDNKDQKDIILKNWATLKFKLLNKVNF